MARRRRGQFPEPKQERGQWKIRYYRDVAQPDGTIRRVRKTKCLGAVNDMTWTQARKEVQRFLQPINDVRAGIEHATKTMQDLTNSWRNSVAPTLKRSTQDSYEWAIGKAMPVFGSTALPEIEKSDVQAFLTANGTRLAPESVRDLRARIRGLFTLAEDWGWIERGENPAAGRMRLPPRSRKRLKPIPTPKQFRTLVGALPQPYRAIVALAGLSGLRRGELAALRWNDFQELRVVVDEAVYRGVVGTPKTQASYRSVALPEVALEILDEWRQQCRFLNPDDFAFSIRTNSP